MTNIDVYLLACDTCCLCETIYVKDGDRRRVDDLADRHEQQHPTHHVGWECWPPSRAEELK